MKTDPDLQTRDNCNGKPFASPPLELAIRETADSRAADIFRIIARYVAAKVAERVKDMSAKLPNIVVPNS